MASRKNAPVNCVSISNQGAVVLLALLFLLLLSLVAATVMRSAILQLRMAGNDQFLEESLHQAQAIATELSLDADSFSLAADVGDINCPQGEEAPDCHQSTLRLPSSALELEHYTLELKVTRQDPLVFKGFPLRENEDAVSSSHSFDAAIFEIAVRLIGSDIRFGSAHIVQGVAIRVPAFH